MLTTELPRTAKSTPANSPQGYELRLHGGTEDGRLLPLPLGKLSLGSGPRCSLQLQDAGVQPLHCLIVHDAGGLRVRSWAKETLLNGLPFEEAGLAPGDRLSVGEVELEVVGLPPEAIEPIKLAGSAEPGFPTAESISQDETPTVPATTTKAVPAATRGSNRLTRERRRKFMAALRFHHHLGIQLEGAVAKLEQQTFELLAGQNHSTGDMARMSESLTTLVEQVGEYHREQALLEQRLADMFEQSRAWEAKLADQQSGLADQQHKLADQQQRLASQEQSLVDQQHELVDQERRVADQQHKLADHEHKLANQQHSLANQEHKLADHQRRLADQEQSLDELQKAAADRGAEHGVRTSLRRRGRKLVAGLRQGRELFRALNERVGGLEEHAKELQQRAQEAVAERDRLRGEIAKSMQQQEALDTQATAWKAVVDATNRLSDNYRQLAAENTRMAGEVEKFAATRVELTTEKAATNEMLAAARAQLQRLEAQKGDLDQQRSQWDEQLQALESRALERDERTDQLGQRAEQLGLRADQLEQEIQQLRETNDAPPISLESLNSLADQVTAVRRQQTELAHQHAKWECRVEDCDSRLNDRIRRIAEIDHELEQLRTAREQQVLRESDWWALSEQVTSLRSQQGEGQQERAAFQNRILECESRLAERVGQFAELERQFAQLREASDVNAAQANQWAALSQQISSLEHRQAAWDQERAAWQSRVQECEARLSDREQKFASVERQLEELRTARADEMDKAPNWPAIAEQISSLQNQLAASDHDRATWQERVHECEARLSDRAEQFAEIERQFEELHAARAVEAAQKPDWAAISEQITSLRNVQAAWDVERTAWQKRIHECESQLSDRVEQFAEVERQVEGLCAALPAEAAAAPDWAAVSGQFVEQFALLRNRLTEIEQQRSAWDAHVADWESRWKERVEQFGSIERELEALRTAYREQSTQVSGLASLFEQLEALQNQEVGFDQLRTEWQDRILEWETQLRDRLRHFESFETALNQLYDAQQKQATALASLAAREYVEPPIPAAAPAPQHDSTAPEWSGPSSDDPQSSAIEDTVNDVRQPIPVESLAFDADENGEPPIDVASSKSAPTQPVSFLERFAGIFPDDEPVEPPQSPPKRFDAPSSHGDEPSTARASAASPDSGHGDEESIENYMAKMMQRIRGDLPGYQPPSSPTSVGNDSTSRTFAAKDEQSNASHRDDRRPTVAIAEEPISEPMFTNVEELKPKTLAPAFTADMKALRALANQTARHAIGIHTARNLRRNAITRLVIAVLASAVALYLMLHAPSTQSLQFYGACVAALASLYWTQLSIASLIRAIRVGAFQHFDEEPEPVNPPLPIDVDRPWESEPVSTIDVDEASLDLDEESEPTGGSDVVEVAEVVSEPDAVQDVTETA